MNIYKAWVSLHRSLQKHKNFLTLSWKNAVCLSSVLKTFVPTVWFSPKTALPICGPHLKRTLTWLYGPLHPSPVMTYILPPDLVIFYSFTSVILWSLHFPTRTLFSDFLDRAQLLTQRIYSNKATFDGRSCWPLRNILISNYNVSFPFYVDISFL